MDINKYIDDEVVTEELNTPARRQYAFLLIEIERNEGTAYLEKLLGEAETAKKWIARKDSGVLLDATEYTLTSTKPY